MINYYPANVVKHAPNSPKQNRGVQGWHGKNCDCETNHGNSIPEYGAGVVVHFPLLAIPKLGLEHHDALANEGGDYAGVEQGQKGEHPDIVVDEHKVD